MRPLPAAVLWDMDGLLVDSEPLWTVAETELAARLGGVFTSDLKAAIVGTRLDVAVPAILAYYGHEAGPAAVAGTSAWLLERMVALFDGPLPWLPGVPDLLGSLREAGVPMALVSSSFRALVDAVLVRAGEWFAFTLAGDEVPVGKPDPGPYLLAAEALGVAPVDCLVLEDSPSGVASGLAAGCRVVAVPRVPGVHLAPHPRLVVRESLAGVTARSLGERG